MTTSTAASEVKAGLLAMDRIAVLLSRLASLGEAVLRAASPAVKARILRQVRNLSDQLAALCVAEAERLEGTTKG